MAKTKETVELAKAFFRTEEGSKCLDIYERCPLSQSLLRYGAHLLSREGWRDGLKRSLAAKFGGRLKIVQGGYPLLADFLKFRVWLLIAFVFDLA